MNFFAFRGFKKICRIFSPLFIIQLVLLFAVKNFSLYTVFLLFKNFFREMDDSGGIDEIIKRETGKQEELAEELRAMAVMMKSTYSTANDLIKQDNAVRF